MTQVNMVFFLQCVLSSLVTFYLYILTFIYMHSFTFSPFVHAQCAPNISMLKNEDDTFKYDDAKVGYVEVSNGPHQGTKDYEYNSIQTAVYHLSKFGFVHPVKSITFFLMIFDNYFTIFWKQFLGHCVVKFTSENAMNV